MMMETMVNWGINTVFGMVGHSNLGVAEALRILEGKGKLRYIGIRHEGAAAFAASGYAKASGRPAACLSIAGPGATNLLTGLWDARVDRVPVLALTGQVQTQFFGPGAFQEIDLPSAFDAVSDFSQTVLPSSKHGELMSLAVKNALVNRNVAHLIFPDEVQTLDAGNEGPGGPDGRLGDTPISPPEGPVSLAMAKINHAKNPVIIVGFGAREAMKEIIALADKLNAPVLTTFKAKGQISDFHPLGCGVLGRSGTSVASTLMSGSDLLIVFGASFSQHTGIDPSKPIIQVDFDRMALGKFHAVSSPVWGDCGVTAEIFSKAVIPDGERQDARPIIAKLWADWREDKKRRRQKNDGNGINSALIFEKLAAAVDSDALISVDVGNNTYSYGQYFESRNQQTIMSGYLGSIGFAFPAAIGAFMAETGRQIVSVSGDGGFGQYMAEFLTAVKYGLNITHILLNNHELGKISKEQRIGGWDVWQTDLANPSFAEYARVCGGFGRRVESPEDLAVDGLALGLPTEVAVGVGLLLIALTFLKSPEKESIDLLDGEIKKRYPKEIATTTLVTREGEEISYTVCNKAEGGILGGIGALFIGMISTGLGEMNGYFLLQRCKVPSRVSIATSVFIVSITALVASISHFVGFLSAGPDTLSLVYSIVIFTIPGVIIGGQIGPLLASRIPQRTLEVGLAVLFILVSGLMLMNVVMA